MIKSMTGFGESEISKNNITVNAEVRSVNGRYLDITVRAPRNISYKEKEIKDIVKNYVNRGNVNINIKLKNNAKDNVPLKINTNNIKIYSKLLNDIRKKSKISDKVKLEHLLTFSDILEPEEQICDDMEWEMVQEAVAKALEKLNEMRISEGKELSKDLNQRINILSTSLSEIEKLSQNRILEEKKLIQERVASLLEDKKILDQNRLELEIALLADKLDITEECVRFKSHIKFFLENLNKEANGRKLNFLVQEINRESNTIGSKTSSAEVAQIVVNIKEELEKIREQLQNIE